MKQDASALIEALSVLTRTLLSHGEHHQVVRQNAELVFALVQKAQPPFALQFVAEAAFRDHILIPVTIDLYKRVVELTLAMENLSVHEVNFDSSLNIESIVSFGKGLAKGSLGPSDFLEDRKIPGIFCQALEGVVMGHESESVDADVAALTQVALARQKIASLQETIAWPWRDGLSIIRRLERAIDSHFDAALLGLTESLRNEDSIHVHQRALLASFHLMRVLKNMGAPKSDTRAAGHCALILCFYGLQACGGLAIEKAAEKALPLILQWEVQGRGGVEPHKLRVCAMINALRKSRSIHSLSPLIELVYVLECERCPKGVAFALHEVDLFALAAARYTQNQDASPLASWARILIAVMGVLPTGAQVWVEGRGMALVIAKGEAPLRPKVKMGAEVFIPKSPVRWVPAQERLAIR